MKSRDARITDIRNGDENLERILLVGFPHASLNVPLDFRLPLLAMTSKPEFLLVAP